jgi:hypothetical protein
MDTLHRYHTLLAESTLFLEEETAAVSDCIRQIEADQELQEQLRQNILKKTAQYNDLRRLAASRHVILEQMTSEIQSKFGEDVAAPVRSMFKVLLSQQIKIVRTRDRLAEELGITSSAATPNHSSSSDANQSAPVHSEMVQEEPVSIPERVSSPPAVDDLASALSFNYEAGSAFLNVVEEEEGGGGINDDLDSDRPPSLSSFGSN